MKFSVPTLVIGLVSLASGAAIEKRAPPNIPSPSSASSMLASLSTRTVDARGYNRLVFPYRGFPSRQTDICVQQLVPPLDHHFRLLQHPRGRAGPRRHQCRHRQRLLPHQRNLVLAVRWCNVDAGFRPRYRPCCPFVRRVEIGRKYLGDYTSCTYPFCPSASLFSFSKGRELVDRFFDLQTTARRQQFANDLANPQLIAVTDNVNQAKGDKSPDQWKPPLASYHCTYACMWVGVKSVYGLSVTADERSALESMLDTC